MPGDGQKRQNEGCQAAAQLCSFLPEKLVRLHRPLRLFSPIATSRRRLSDDFHNGSQSLESLPTPPHSPHPPSCLPHPQPLPSLLSLPHPQNSRRSSPGNFVGFLAGTLDGGGASASRAVT